MQYISLCVLSLGLLVAGCDLMEVPVDTASRETVFGTESGLRLYTNSFYDILPSANEVTRGDAMSDYAARRDVPLELRPGAYSSSTTGGWNWGALRNINYFLEHNEGPEVPASVRQHYDGLARFFRAWFYFEKVQRYGDVPWIGKVLDISDPELMGGRDPRALVMDSVLADLDYAIEHIQTERNQTRTVITKDAALALKARIALFEGTFRKYHPEAGLTDTADRWLREAAAAAQAIMDRGLYALHQGDPDEAYRELFVTDAPNSSEDILAVVHDVEASVLHSANWWYTSATYGVRLSFVRPFIHTYLNVDGTPFTDRPGYETMTFVEEMEGRDKRLHQTLRAPGYTRVDAGVEVPMPPAFSYTYTGYHPIKWTLDDTGYDGWVNNTNSVPIFRYAEVLLIYAEAKAELGTLTASDWERTIGALRSRAGITGGISTLPSTVDPYFQSTYFPNVSDPVILEVRRERGIELALEGHRFYDLVRWKAGELMEMEWRGIYVPEVNQHMDLNADGAPDVYFYDQEPAADDRRSGVIYLDVTGGGFELTNGTSGELVWRRDIAKAWEDKLYLYPIPESDLLTNPNLGQNPGW